LQRFNNGLFEFCDTLLAEQNFAGIKYQYTDVRIHLLLFIEFYTHYTAISVCPQSQFCGMQAQIWPTQIFCRSAPVIPGYHTVKWLFSHVVEDGDRTILSSA